MSGNDQGDTEALPDRAPKHGVPGLAIGQPGSIAQLVLAVAAEREVPVACIPGLVIFLHRTIAEYLVGRHISELPAGRRMAIVAEHQ